MSTNPKSKNKRQKYKILLISVVVLILVGGVLTAGGAYVVARARGEQSSQLTFRVEQGPLRIKVTGTGTISPLQQTILRCQVEGRSTILYLIDQGVEVEKDTLLVKLDSSQLEDRMVSQDITVRNITASLAKADATLLVTLSQNKSNISKAKLDLEFAQQDLNKYLEGEYPQQLQKIEGDITLAQVELTRATDKLFYSKQLHEKGFITRTELQADELSLTKNKISLSLAKTNLELLKKYTNVQRLRQLRSDIDQANMALERVQAKAAADEAQARADQEAKQLELTRQKERFEKLKGQLVNCVIRAPEAGKVVYASTAQRSRWRPQEALEEGSEVREGQELIYLPMPGGMKATVKVHESSLSKLKAAQKASENALPVMVSIDSKETEGVYWGWVHSVAPMPDSGNWMRPDVKVYDVEVHLSGNTQGLITGMTCRADIIIQDLSNAIYVPVQAILRDGQTSYVDLVEDGKRISYDVQVGMSDIEYARILSGLEPGQLVSMNPRLRQKESHSQGKSGPEALPDTPGKRNGKSRAPDQAKPKPQTEADPKIKKNGDMTFEKFKAMSSEDRKTWSQSAGREGMRAFYRTLTEEQRKELRSMRQGSGRSGREGGQQGARQSGNGGQGQRGGQ